MLMKENVVNIILTFDLQNHAMPFKEKGNWRETRCGSSLASRFYSSRLLDIFLFLMQSRL
jgi:hypothetical protein